MSIEMQNLLAGLKHRIGRLRLMAVQGEVVDLNMMKARLVEAQALDEVVQALETGKVITVIRLLADDNGAILKDEEISTLFVEALSPTLAEINGG